ncbi:Rho-GAP domain-containing protein [Entamoeba marina]
MKLCYRITLNKDQTGIDSLTLAKILAPNLCWLEGEGITGNIYHLVEMLIAEYVIIFEDIDKELLEKEQSYLDIKNANEKAYMSIKEKLRQELITEEKKINDNLSEVPIQEELVINRRVEVNEKEDKKKKKKDKKEKKK